MRELHVVVLGAGGVGKSCLTARFVHNEWIESYDPTIEDTYRAYVQIDGRQITLEILDTAGTEQFVAMRDLYMKNGQGFLLVFSITSASSFGELAGLREEIFRIKDDDNIPIVIVGNKADLEDQRMVPRARAYSISSHWCAPYYETSARTKANVNEVFTDLCRQILMKEDGFGSPMGFENAGEGFDASGSSEGQKNSPRVRGEGKRDSKRRLRREQSRASQRDWQGGSPSVRYLDNRCVIL